MKKWIWIGLILGGFASREASAFEAGLGIGYISNCVERGSGLSDACAQGPTLSGQWGLNLWGKNYSVASQEKSSRSPITASTESSSNFNTSGFHVFSGVDDWKALVAVALLSLFIVSFGYAILYPFSSRADLGFVGRTAYQSGQDIDLIRSEAGLYFRAYLSQHFPMYIYGSGVFSHQNLTLGGDDQAHNVFVKRIGLGFMSPETAGLYLQGTFERNSLLDPTAKDLVEDATTERLRKQSVKKVLDASHFELGYLWYY